MRIRFKYRIIALLLAAVMVLPLMTALGEIKANAVATFTTKINGTYYTFTEGENVGGHYSAGCSNSVHYCCWNNATELYKNWWGSTPDHHYDNFLWEVLETPNTTDNIKKWLSVSEPGSRVTISNEYGSYNGHTIIFLGVDNSDPENYMWIINTNGHGTGLNPVERVSWSYLPHYSDNPNYFPVKYDKIVSIQWPGAASEYNTRMNSVTCSISYNANGGSGAPAKQTYTYATSGSTTLSSTKPTRTGYTFLGWALSSSATSAQYSAGQSWALSNKGDYTLYAVWKANTYSISYNLNGGSLSAGTNALYDDPNGKEALNPTSARVNAGPNYSGVTYPYNWFRVQTPTRRGYTFNGWTITGMDNSEHHYWYGGNQTSTATSWANTSDAGKANEYYNLRSSAGTVTFTANWLGETCTISYDANGGSGAPAKQTYTYADSGTTSISSTIPTRSGYTFLGWALDKDATHARYSAGHTWNLNNRGNYVLYAVWASSTYTITYEANGGTGMIAPQTKIEDEPITISSGVFWYSGYQFIGWNTEEDGTGTYYAPGDTYTVNKSITLYAQWISGGLSYVIVDEEVTIDRYRGQNGDVIIPKAIEGKLVTTIGDSSFAYCYDLTSITIPDSVITIGDFAFNGCKSLTTITIPDSVTTIGDYAFNGCTGLVSITVSEENPIYHSAGNCLIETVSRILIAGCNTSVIPSDGSVTTIGNHAFNGCKSLTTITIPDSVTTIGKDAFYGCTGLTFVSIPDGVSSICSEAFCYCSGLTEITIPNSVSAIESGAFSHCQGLISATIPDSVTSIGSYAFYGCKSLTTITIPDSVTSIGYFAFSCCTGLISITVAEGNTAYHSAGDCLIETASKTLIAGCNTSVIPSDGSVTSIGREAFCNCSNLLFITIPDSVTTIDVSAFEGCISLATVYFTGSEEEWNAISIGNCNDSLRNATIIFNYNSVVHEHSWSQPTYTWSRDYSICTAARSCSVCNEAETEMLTVTSRVTIAATCTEKGTKAYTASFTNTAFTTQTKVVEIPASGHTPSDWIIDREAAVGVAGSKHKECTVCHTVLETATIPALEGPTPVDPDAPQIVVESKTVNQGREFTVSVTVENNPGVMAMTLVPVFSEGLTLVKATNGVLLSDFTAGKNYFWTDNADVTEDGVLMTLTFTTAEDLDPGDYTVSFRLWDSSDSEENDVPFAIVSGVITVTDITWGDANGDGIVNNKDIVRLKNYFANLDVDTGVSTYEIFAGADANGDGIVNNKDIVRLKNYFANLDVETGISTYILGPAA